MNPIRPPQTSQGKVFRHGDRFVWYDTNQNSLLEIDPALAAVLPLFAEDNDDEVLARLVGSLPEAAVRQAMHEIREAREHEALFILAGPEADVPADAALGATAHTELGHLTLCLSEVCNLRCGYCPQASAAIHGSTVMTRETALKALHWFAARCADAPVRNVSFYGGEPLLQFDLVAAVVRETAAHPDWPAIEFTLDTNATLITDDIARFIIDHELRLQVSLDGPPEVHDRHRRLVDGQPTHAAVMAGLRRLLAMDPAAAARVRFAATVTPPYDFLALSAYFEDLPLYRELGITAKPAVRFNAANLDGTEIAARGDQWQANMSLAREHYLQSHLAGRRNELPRSLAGLLDGSLVRWHHRPRRPLAGSAFPAGACRPGGRRVFVAPDGTLMPCERVGAGRRIGHVDTGLDREAIVALHRELLDLLDGACRTCWARRMCHVCFTAVRPELSRDEARRRAEMSCESSRRSAAATIEMYLHICQGNPRALGYLVDTRLV